MRQKSIKRRSRRIGEIHILIECGSNDVKLDGFQIFLVLIKTC